VKSFGTEVVLLMVKRFGVTLITRGASKKRLAVQPPFKGAAMVVESSALGFQPHFSLSIVHCRFEILKDAS
jgi:hypothetical protein